MPPESRDQAYIWDMLDSAKTVQSFVDVISYDEYIHDRKMQLAVERALEIKLLLSRS